MITDSTLDTSIFTDIRTKIVNANLSVTTQSTGVVTSASIEASYNDKNPTRPMIIIHPVLIDKNNDKFGSTNNKMMINVIIDCFGKDTLSMDQLAVGVHNVLDVNDITGIDLISSTSDYAFSMPGDNKYQLKTLVFNYQRE